MYLCTRVCACGDISCVCALARLYTGMHLRRYITGESYAGHYIPAFGAYIHAQNQRVAAEANGGFVFPFKVGESARQCMCPYTCICVCVR